MEAVVAYLATFYLLDFDYPRHHEMGLNVLQYYLFQDTNVPNDIAASFNAHLDAYKQFKSSDQ